MFLLTSCLHCIFDKKNSGLQTLIFIFKCFLLYSNLYDHYYFRPFYSLKFSSSIYHQITWCFSINLQKNCAKHRLLFTLTMWIKPTNLSYSYSYQLISVSLFYNTHPLSPCFNAFHWRVFKNKCLSHNISVFFPIKRYVKWYIYLSL